MQPLKYLKLTSHLLKYHQVMLPVALAFASIAISNKAEALSFNFTFSDNTPPEVRSVFWDAGDAWSNQFQDDVTVNIFVDYGTLPANVLAGSRPGMTRVTYSEFLTRLRQDKSSQDGLKYVSQTYDDAYALSKLQSGSSFKYLKGVSTQVNGNTVWLTRANARALGIISQNTESDTAFDASIRVSSTTAWHYDPNTAAPNTKYDLLTVAKHEIGHALGFVSGIDASQLLSTSDNLLEYVTPMDLLRYSKKSAALGIPDWTTGETFFSLDGGTKSLADFSRGATVDGFQAGHWKYGSSNGIMDPFLKTGARWEIGALDRRILDAIGWDYAPQLSKNVAAVMLSINWNTSNPDLSQLENLFKAHLRLELEKLGEEGEAIREWDAYTWWQLAGEVYEEYQKRQEEIQNTLKKVRDNKSDPNKRMEEALKGASDQLEALAELIKDCKEKLKAPLSAKISYSLNSSAQEMKKQLKDATLLQIRTLSERVEGANESQKNEWKKDMKESLRLLYLETHNNQNPSELELNMALEKLTDAAAPDGGLGTGKGWRFWQTGGSQKPSFEKTGEFTFHSMAAPEISDVESAGKKMGMLGLLGLLTVGFLLKVKKLVVSTPDRG